MREHNPGHNYSDKILSNYTSCDSTVNIYVTHIGRLSFNPVEIVFLQNVCHVSRDNSHFANQLSFAPGYLVADVI